ncbi:10388_t:CDS:10 [Acaulospora colombiana]|uniref:10388_t:CDS:1 n=1 Tax=Acaulospora colombiana TaxID=27376 RepID=A0ACA9KN75_9GLOM|nr:10388_t:CDS:10 [Acaulospora colombiana]
MNQGEKIHQFNVLYKEYESVVDDLKTALLEFLPELQQELDLNFTQVEYIRQYLNDRGTLFRFLRRAGFDFDSSFKELIADLRWRIENQVDTLSIQDVHLSLIERGLFFIHKTDKFNRPCAIINLREYFHENGSPTIEEIKKFIIFVAEVARRLLWDRNKKSGDEPVLQYVILLDLKGAGVTTLDLELGPFAVDIMRHHFPGSVGAKHGGSDDYEYDLETCEAFQRYGNPFPILLIPTPLSRVTSFDSLHDVFFSAHTTPYNSRPSTPFFSRTATPVSTPYPSRPASPGLDHAFVPNWLKMTPRNPSTQNETRSNLVSPKPVRSDSRHLFNPQFQFTTINPEGPAFTSHNNYSHHDVDSTTRTSHVLESSNHHVHFDEKALQHINSPSPKECNYQRAISKGRKPPSLYRFLRVYTKLTLYSKRLLRRFIARKISGVLSYLIMVVILRGGLINEFWKFMMQQVTMKFGWISTKPFNDQKPGTSGLRKRVKVFQQENYTLNFIQATLNAMPAPGAKGSTLVVGGDGRYYSKEAVNIIIRVAAGNQLLQTSSASVKPMAGFSSPLLITQEVGPDHDFGIKFNVSNGGPAPESVTNLIYEHSKKIEQVFACEVPEIDLSTIGTQTFGDFTVEIVDSVHDYVILLKEIFDFELIRGFLVKNPDFKLLFDGLHGVTGPYAERIFIEELGLPRSTIQNYVPLPDFGGGHPDPNLTYANSLVERVERENINFGAASDGDGDRNMIYGKGAFVTPSDSVAVIAAHAEVIPYFQKTGVKGLARSMPTSAAIDLVAKKKGLEIFEVPTGWKFFGNLMDAGRLSICGEESFGTGSDHIREKDGIWAVAAWLNIIAATNEKKPGTGIKEILLEHYQTYGRNFFSRYDYEEVNGEDANKMIAHLRHLVDSGKDRFVGKTFGQFTVSSADDFEYRDPIDNSVSKNQGIRIIFTDGSRIVVRLSGTGSQGATIRLYMEKYSRNASEYESDTQEALKPLIDVALEISELRKFTGREKPTVIT